MKAKFRMNLDGVGRPLYLPFIEQLNKYYLNNGAWDDNTALMIVGDFSQAMYSVREDMTVKISADAATNYGGALHSMFDEAPLLSPHPPSLVHPFFAPPRPTPSPRPPWSFPPPGLPPSLPRPARSAGAPLFPVRYAPQARPSYSPARVQNSAGVTTKSAAG